MLIHNLGHSCMGQFDVLQGKHLINLVFFYQSVRYKVVKIQPMQGAFLHPGKIQHLDMRPFLQMKDTQHKHILVGPVPAELLIEALQHRGRPAAVRRHVIDQNPHPFTFCMALIRSS